MKILFAIDSLIGGGAERVVSILANSLAIKGNQEVSIALLSDNTIEYVINDNISIYDFQGNRISNMISLKKDGKQSGKDAENRYDILDKVISIVAEYKDTRRRAKDLACFINREHYDVVISFLTSSNEILCYARPLISRTIKVIISERNDPGSTVLNTWSGKHLSWLYGRADKIVFQTEYAKLCYPSQLQHKGIVIPNPVKEELPNRFTGARRDEIITFGRLTAQKNLPLLISAFASVQKKHPEYRLRMFGKGSMAYDLKQMITNMGLDEVAFIDDFQENIHEIVRDAAMYVSSSDYEGISNSMLEAMAIGLPCVCTDCPAGGARMAIADEENGLLVPVGDEKALEEAMLRIIEDKDFSESISYNATHIKEKWSVDNISDMWLNAINELF